MFMADSHRIGMFLTERKPEMKKGLVLICALFVLSLSACENQVIAPETQTGAYALSEPQTNAPEKKKATMQNLTEIDGVLSVTELTFASSQKGAVAYKVYYESENGKLTADVVLPEDYYKESKNYTVLFYFPQVGFDIDFLAQNYAKNKIIVIRPYARGYDESEGMRDLGGPKDLADAQKLLEIFDSAGFIDHAKAFVAGSSEGSVVALRLFAEDEKKRISGCAVVDVIPDLHALEVFRGEQISNLLTALIGSSYEESPDDYTLRSAVSFTEKLDRPVLILHYLQNPFVSEEHTDTFFHLLKETNTDCTCVKIDALSVDFQGESLQRLLSWIGRND